MIAKRPFRMTVGWKLGVLSAIGILLVMVMVGVSLFSGAAALSHAEREGRQIDIVAHLTRATVALREMQMASRDMRLAKTAEDAELAFEAEAERHQQMAESLVGAKTMMSVPENIEQAKNAEAAAKDYLVQSEALLEVLKAQMAQPAGIEVTDLDETRARIEAEMRTAAADVVAQFEEIVERAEKIEDESARQTTAEIASGQMIGAVIGALVVLMLLGSAVFGAKSIAKPIRFITARMSTLADNDLESVIPYVGRADEIGEMAAAVQVFKDNAIKVAEMNAAEAVRTGQTRERAKSMGDLVSALSAVVNAAVDGDFSRRIEVQPTDDDLRGVASGVNTLLETVDRGLTEAGAVLAALARTDLTMHVEGEYKGAFAKLKADTNSVVDSLGEIVTQLRQTSGTLKTATGEILSGANDLAERTTKQAAAIEETSAAMEQLAATVVGNAKRAESASAKAQSVSRTAEETGEVMRKSNEAMERINSSSSKISNIIGMIDDIAFQTNLLALNASVEAARAGDAGKGFAVVAVEVRRLAQSAASASSEVKSLIEKSAAEVVGGSKLVAEATSKLASMLDDVRESATLTQGITEATQEQSSAIAQVTVAIRQMDEMTQHNAALVEETNAAIEQTEGQANELDRIVEVFVVEHGTPRLALTEQQPPEPKSGIRVLQAKVKSAAKSYLTSGNTALKNEWSEF